MSFAKKKGRGPMKIQNNGKNLRELLARLEILMLHFSEFNKYIGLDSYNELDKKYK